MAKRATNPEALVDPIPEIAIQVYSTVHLDLDAEHEYTALCRYLSSRIHDYPQLSFEIYGPQPDVFTCVEHQRREILHRKNNFPGEGLFYWYCQSGTQRGPTFARVSLSDYIL